MRDGTKSAEFRRLHDEGHSVAEIARMTSNYYSFVYRVIGRYTSNDHVSTKKEPSLRSQIRDLCGTKNVDEIIKHLDLSDKDRSKVYKIMKEVKGT